MERELLFVMLKEVNREVVLIRPPTKSLRPKKNSQGENKEIISYELRVGCGVEK